MVGAVRQTITRLYRNIRKTVEERHGGKDLRVKAGAQGIITRGGFHGDASRSKVSDCFILRDRCAFGGSQHTGFVFFGKDEKKKQAEKEAGGSRLQQESPMQPNFAQMGRGIKNDSLSFHNEGKMRI